MKAPAADWKRQARALFVPLASVHGSWFPKALRRHVRLLDAAGQSTGKLLRRCLPAGGERIAGGGESLPAWAEWDAASQRRLVLRLGAIACAAPIRRSIAKNDLDALRGVIGDEIHREAIAATAAAEPLVGADLSEDYRRALGANRLGQFLTGIGLSVLLRARGENRPYVSFRLRYLFPAAAWSARRTDLGCNESAVARLLRQEPDG